MKIYVASSWRCELQPTVVTELRAAGHEVYDFRNPSEGDNGFHWSEIDADWQGWPPAQYRAALETSIAERGFASDYAGMTWAEACILVLPCGRSAHLEAGWFAGKNKPLHILVLEKCEPELMYKLATSICLTMDELLAAIQDHTPQSEEAKP
jgi:hypothetical protein